MNRDIILKSIVKTKNQINEYITNYNIKDDYNIDYTLEILEELNKEILEEDISIDNQKKLKNICSYIAINFEEFEFCDSIFEIYDEFMKIDEFRKLPERL